MQRRSGKELRELFLSYFEGKGCKRLHSFSLVPDDPTLLFTIAGMVPFKPYFLGLKTPEFTRATTSQKCIRTNDIENVGRTARHHTFFEMLGNFSFGDYFKSDVIPWAWTFLTEYIGLEPERLYVTVHITDDEAHDIWHKKVGVPENHIVRFDEDNFWAAGPVGPCGPCSEILYDQGEAYSCGKPTCGVGCDCDRYLEIWNLVFMQFSRDKDGKLTPLPKKNIDTGMGLERLASIVQNVRTDFETDLFKPIIDETCKLVNVEYGTDPKKDMAVRVISDHMRAAAFMIADGILPSNDGRGYVLRRLIRRSVRFGRLMGIDKPFLTGLLPAVRESIGDEYTELAEQSSAIQQVLKTEEEHFSKTLSQGSDLLDTEIAKLAASGNKTLSGDTAFVLYDTFGFPYELTEEICQERSIAVDKEGFEKAMEEQRDRARNSSKQLSSVIKHTVYTDIADKHAPSQFCGYTDMKSSTKVLAIIVDGEERNSAEEKTAADIILENTPFYAEKGGQVGDTGTITADGMKFEVKDTVYPTPELIIHRGTIINGTIREGDHVLAEVDEERRKNIQRHHTATHLLQEALTRVLGKHVRQAGSLVTPTFLRFDFNHFAPMTIDQIRQVENIVYEQVLKNLSVMTTLMSLDEAKKSGARALFDEKYGNIVRVLDISGFSTELCGGTHVKHTGDIGLVKIINEEGIGGFSEEGQRYSLDAVGLAAGIIMPHGIQNVLPLDPVGDALCTGCGQIPDVLVAGLADQRRSLLVRLRNRIGIQQIKGSALNHVDLLVRLVQQHIRYGEAVGDIGKVAQNDLVAAAGAQQVQVHMRPDKALGLVKGAVKRFLIACAGQEFLKLSGQFSHVRSRYDGSGVLPVESKIFIFGQAGKGRYAFCIEQGRKAAVTRFVNDDVACRALNQHFELLKGIFHPSLLLKPSG